MTGDHAGWPATPGMGAALAILQRGIEAGDRQRRADARRAARDRADRRLGEVVASLPAEEIAALAEGRPALASALLAVRTGRVRD